MTVALLILLVGVGAGGLAGFGGHQERRTSRKEGARMGDEEQKGQTVTMPRIKCGGTAVNQPPKQTEEEEA